MATMYKGRSSLSLGNMDKYNKKHGGSSKTNGYDDVRGGDVSNDDALYEYKPDTEFSYQPAEAYQFQNPTGPSAAGLAAGARARAYQGAVNNSAIGSAVSAGAYGSDYGALLGAGNAQNAGARDIAMNVDNIYNQDIARTIDLGKYNTSQAFARDQAQAASQYQNSAANAAERERLRAAEEARRARLLALAQFEASQEAASGTGGGGGGGGSAADILALWRQEQMNAKNERPGGTPTGSGLGQADAWQKFMARYRNKGARRGIRRFF